MQDESSAITIPIGQILYSLKRIQDQPKKNRIVEYLHPEEGNREVCIDLLGTRETKISRPQDVKKINQNFSKLYWHYYCDKFDYIY